MSRATTTKRPRKAAAGPATRRTPQPSLVGANGARVIAIGSVDVEILATDVYQGEQRVTSIQFPVPGTGRWATVQIGLLDGTRWTIGYDGWQYDEYPTLHSAIDAICDPKTRKQILDRTARTREWFDLKRQARQMYEQLPPVPDGACPSSWPGVVP